MDDGLGRGARDVGIGVCGAGKYGVLGIDVMDRAGVTGVEDGAGEDGTLVGTLGTLGTADGRAFWKNTAMSPGPFMRVIFGTAEGPRLKGILES
jgi:hypothetical protein